MSEPKMDAALHSCGEPYCPVCKPMYVFPTKYAVPTRPPVPFDKAATKEEVEAYYESFNRLRTDEVQERLTEREEE